MKFKVFLLSSLLTLGTVSAVADEPKVDDSKPTTGDTLEQADAITEQATQPVKEKYWKCTGILSLNASATGLWNWAAGGNNNITTVAAANITLLYQKNSVAWETNLDTDFGMTYLESEFPHWDSSEYDCNVWTNSPIIFPVSPSENLRTSSSTPSISTPKKGVFVKTNPIPEYCSAACTAVS